MNNIKFLSIILVLTVLFNFAVPISTTYAGAVDDVLGTLTSSTMNTSDNGGNFIEKLFSFIFDKILGPIFNLGGGGNTNADNSPVKVTPLPPRPSSGSGTIADSGVLNGKVIVVDPGHGGTNPGAVGNNTREADNNLAVGLKLRDKLVQAGAKVVMTRTTDRNVAAVGSSLGQELQARVDIAVKNNADMFISIHSNSNPDSSIAGAMTFYPSSKSQQLALEVQSALVSATGSVDKGISPATFYVLRNTPMPSILVEMGFVTNAQEAQQLQSDQYRNKIATGIFNGVVKYLQ